MEDIDIGGVYTQVKAGEMGNLCTRHSIFKKWMNEQIFGCSWAFSSCERGYSLVVVHALLTVVASLVAEHGL